MPGIGVTIFFYAKKEYPYSGIVLPSLIIFTCITLLFNTYIFPSVFSLQAPPKAARYFTENSGSKDKLFNYRYEQYELFFYSEPQALQINSSEDLKETVGKKGNWIFTNADGLKDLQALEYNPDTLIEYKHLYLNKGGQFINPKTRDKVLQPMYLLKY